MSSSKKPRRRMQARSPLTRRTWISLASQRANWEILGLIAARLSDREIAGRLFGQVTSGSRPQKSASGKLAYR